MGISIHALREESDLGQLVFIVARVFISIHALREESDCLRPAGERTRKRISIHALREESDSISKSPFTFVDDFNPRPPRGERPRDLCGCVLHGIDFNPRPPRGERPIPQVLPALLFAISIHALREESDRRLSSHSCRTGNFNPRPPRGERHQFPRIRLQLLRFQSTPSARRATTAGEAMPLHLQISIHALREESDCGVGIDQSSHVQISIHALREESDVFHVAVYKDLGISIHALREESDQEEKQCHTEGLYFNPRPPRGERRPRPRPAALSAKFQSTPSARRATRYRFHPNHLLSHFNPRPPRGERQSLDYLRGSVRKFQSTPSARRATINGINNGIENAKFQSTPSARRATSCICSYSPAGHYFNPRPPRGGRQIPHTLLCLTVEFQSTPSARRATGQDFVAVDPRLVISIHALREEGDVKRSAR